MKDDKFANKPQSAEMEAGLNQCCAPQSAKEFLRERIAYKQRELDGLRVLHDTLPDAMLAEADQALWSILVAR